MSEKQFNCVLGKDYHIINNNVDNMTYYLQDGNDVVLLINLLNRLVEENEQLEKGKMEALSLLGEEIDKNEQLRKQVAEYELILRQHEFAEKEGFQ